MTEEPMGQFPVGARDFSLLHSVHTGCGVSCLDTRNSFLEDYVGGDKKMTPPFHLAARLKNSGVIPPPTITAC
jgi:hypothetical protein